LGDAAYYLNPLLDGDDGREGGLDCVGVHKWRMPSNWKFPATSFNGDAAHGSITHRSTQVAAYGPQEDKGNTADRHSDRLPRERYEVTVARLGHGGHFSLHSADEPYVPTWPTVSPLVDDYYREAYGERMRRFAGQTIVEGGCGIFPNFSTGGAARTFVVWHPDGVQSTEAWRFYFVDQQAPREARDAMRRFQMRYAGPVGMTESDDMENWNYASAASSGVIARRYPYNYQMGLGHEKPAGRIPGQLSQVRSESNQRARFGRWLEFMEAPNWSEMYPLKD
ncbi:MAG TPA: SRPBCC family protein, partial [Chloroflexota bacterium]